MPRDQCTDCETNTTEGQPLTEGRCPRCYAAFKERQATTKSWPSATLEYRGGG